MSKVLISVIVTLLVLGAIGLIIVFSGVVNVAATEPDPGLVKWTFSTAMDNSVRYHAKDIAPPPLDDPKMIEEGFEHFNEMCVPCHGAPGVPRDEMGKGLNPFAPDLKEPVEEWSPAELFWITKHGIKMTGMPAWGVTHSDEKIWAIVAFMRKLPSMSSDDYDKYVQRHSDEEGGEHEEEADEHEH